MYCENCGTKLGDEANFCPGCGQKVAKIEQPDTSQPIAVQPQAPEGERAFMVLNASRKDGLLKRTNIYMVFFKDSLVIAELTAQRQKEETQAVTAKNKEAKGGFLKGSMALMDHWASYGSKYYSMTRAEILAEETTNMEIPHRDISRFLFSRLESNSSGDNTTSTGGAIEVQHRFGKVKASHTYHDSNQNIKKVLQSLYSTALKYRGSKILFSKGHRDGFV